MDDLGEYQRLFLSEESRNSRLTGKPEVTQCAGEDSSKGGVVTNSHRLLRVANHACNHASQLIC